MPVQSFIKFDSKLQLQRDASDLDLNVKPEAR